MYFILGFTNPCSRGLITRVVLIEVGSNNSKKKYILKKFKQPILRQYYYDGNLDFVTSNIPKCDNIYFIGKDGIAYKYNYKQQVVVQLTTNEKLDLIDSTPTTNFLDLYNNYSLNMFASTIAESLEDQIEY